MNNPEALAMARSDPAQWALLLEWEVEASKSLVEAGTHIIVVAEKAA